MKKLLIALVSASMLAASVQAEEKSLANVAGAADLEQVKRAKFRETYVNTAVDFSQYDKIYYGEAIFDYRDAPPAQRYSSMRSTSSRAVFGISDKDRDSFEELVGEAFEKELGKSKHFTITQEVDEKTMIMRGGLVDIVSRVPPEPVGSGDVYLATVGEATLILEFVDGKTGEVLARIGERGRIGRPGGQLDAFSMPANSVTIRADIKRWASSSAKRLRSELDYAMGG